MKELLELGLLIGGGSLVLLCIGSFWIPKTLEWKKKLTVLTPLMRELWWTYSIYVWSSHVFFAVLALGFGEWQMSRTAPATAMVTFQLLWWSVRLWLQFFGFDLAEVKATPLNRWAKRVLTCLFAGLVVLYGGLLVWNAGMGGEGGVP